MRLTPAQLDALGVVGLEGPPPFDGADLSKSVDVVIQAGTLSPEDSGDVESADMYKSASSARLLLLRKGVCDHSHRIRQYARWHAGGDLGHVALCPDCHAVLPLGRAQRRLAKAYGRRRKFKVMEKALGEDERWITVHPGGNKEIPGTPVLIKLHPDGTAHVIGGAGGSLNYKVLTQLRSPEDLQHEAMKRRKERQEKDQERTKEIARTAPDALQRMREHQERIQEEMATAKADYLQKVAEAQGWGEVRLSDEQRGHMSDDSVRRVEAARERRMVAAAERVSLNITKEVIERANEDVAQSLGEVAFEDMATPAIDSGDGRGYVAALERVAEEHGFIREVAREESQDLRMERLEDAEARGLIKSAQAAEARIVKMQVGAAAAREEDAPFRDIARPTLSEEPQDWAKAKELLVARQQYREREKALRAELAGVRGLEAEDVAREFAKDKPLVPAGVALVEPLSVDAALQKVELDIQDRAMKQAAVDLLNEVETGAGGREHLSQHVNTGRSTQLDELSFALTGSPAPLDRVVTDVLGNEGSAALFAHYLRENLTPEKLAEVTAALAGYHRENQEEAARKAVADAQEHLKGAAHAVEGYPDPAQADAMTLLSMQSALQEQRKETETAREILGAALGRLETLGELNSQLASPTTQKSLPISMGEKGLADVIRLGTAMGLDYGSDFTVEGSASGSFLRLAPSAYGKLLNPADVEQAKQFKITQAIKQGKEDEEGWLPAGFARHATADYSEGASFAHGQHVAPELAGLEGDKLTAGLERYVGRSLAEDGAGTLHELRLRMLDPAWQDDHVEPDQREALGAWVAEHLPPKVTGDPRKAAVLAEKFLEAAAADEPGHTALDNQSLAVGNETYEAMHRALAEFPMGKSAWAPLSGLTPEDTRNLRAFFWQHVAQYGDQPKAAETRARREKLLAKMAEKVSEQADLFGETHVVTYGDTDQGKAQWEREFGEGQDQTAWETYVNHMHGLGGAYRALQESMQGTLLEGFAKYNQELTGEQIRAGKAPLYRAMRHHIGSMGEKEYASFSGGMSPKDREALDALRGRKVKGSKAGGQYASGSVKDLLARIAEGNYGEGLQMFTGQQQLPSRFTIGRTAENQARRVWSQIAPAFDGTKPVRIPTDVSMSGKYVHQQRAVRILEATHRLALNHSTGSGKTATGLGCFTELQAKGKAKRALYILPTGILGQFNDECLAYLAPGRFNWFSKVGASAAERRAAYADPSHHIVGVSHQGLRDDLTWAVAQAKFGGDEKAADGWMVDAPEAERRTSVQSAIDAQGWKFDFTMLDEGHDELNRIGKKPSRLANAVDSLTANVPYYVNSTATAVKNDPSEAFDLLHKLRPDKFTRDKRDEFMRRYGLDTAESHKALQYLMAPYIYSYQADTGVQRVETDRDVSISPQQGALYRSRLAAYNRARKAPVGSAARRKAVRELMPPARLEGLSEEEAKAAIDRAGTHLSAVRDMALYRAAHADPALPAEHNGAIQDALAYVKSKAGADHDGGIEPGIMFTWSRESARQLTAQLQKAGYRVGRMTGEQTSTEFDSVRRGFRPDVANLSTDPAERAKAQRDAAQYDILVATDAASTGLNLQRGRWIYHYDRPWTAKTMIQRNGRADRFGQDSPEIEVAQAQTNTPLDRRRAEVVRNKYSLHAIISAPSETLDDSGFAHYWQQAYDEDEGEQVDRRFREAVA